MYQSNQRGQGGFGIESALCYADGRAHFVFTDKTSIILHPKGDCFTYYRKDGKKVRQLIQYAINNQAKVDSFTGGPLDKLCLAAQLFNTYYDKPLLNRKEFYNNPNSNGLI